MHKTGRLIVISGPSGVGKSTITRLVLQRTGAQYSVSMTTRPQRDGEVDGQNYHFVDRAAFEKMVADGAVLEWAEVFGELYGTPGEPVRQTISAGRAMVLEIDVQGGLQVHRQMPDAVFILVLPPDEAELTRRLAGRGSESPESLKRRLAKANEEIAAAEDSGVYNYRVVNDDLETAVRQIVEIITQECCRQ